MNSNKFLLVTGLAIVGLAGAVALINLRINLYGLYGDVRGQSRAVASNERWSKYLYAFNQIPSNYDSLLVGSSLSANLETSAVRGFKMYNLSMTGANVAEEQILLDQALEHGRYRLIVFCVYPYMLKDHALKAGRMVPRDYWSGLGSLPLLEDYLITTAIRAHVFQARFTTSGAQDLESGGIPRIAADAALRLELQNRAGPVHFAIDPDALQQLTALVRRARSSGARVVAYIPATYGPRYYAMREAYSEFESRILQLFAPGEAVLDFNDGTLAAFADDADNFLDGTHYTRAGARVVTRAFADRLQAALVSPTPDAPR